MKFRNCYIFCLLFILLLLNPSLTYGDNSDKKTSFTEHLTSARNDWEQSESLINKCRQLPKEKKDEKIPLLDKALVYCKRALAHYNAILTHKNAKKDKEKQRVATCRNNIDICKKQINDLTISVNHLKWNWAIEDLEKEKSGLVGIQIDIANAKNFQALSTTGFQKIDLLKEVVSSVQNAISHYQQLFDSISKTGDAAYQATLSSFLQQISSLIVTHKQSAEAVKQQIVQLEAEKQALVEHLSKLTEESVSLESQGLLRSSCDIHKQMVAITNVLNRDINIFLKG